VDLYAIATQLGAALAVPTPALRVYQYGATKVEAPAAVVALPDGIDYHQAYGTGASKLEDLVVLVLVRDLNRRTSFKTLAGYAAASGAGSVKAALEAFVPAGRAWDTLTVARVDFDVVTMAGADYLTALFHLDLFGPGT
jgi:hypothetical protein